MHYLPNTFFFIIIGPKIYLFLVVLDLYLPNQRQLIFFLISEFCCFLLYDTFTPFPFAVLRELMSVLFFHFQIFFQDATRRSSKTTTTVSTADAATISTADAATISTADAAAISAADAAAISTAATSYVPSPARCASTGEQ
jgi:hypothetical protein